MKVKKLIASLLRLPANILLASSSKLPVHVRHHARAAALANPCLSAKFYPYAPDKASYLVPPTGPPPRRPPVPPPGLMVHSYLSPDPKAYLEAGRSHVGRMLEILGGLPDEANVLDFGCGDGMMLRHLESREGGESWGVDINGELTLWCQQNLSPPFKFLTTTSFPHLPFEDNYFDLIYSFSVFTHICDLADAWLLELRRTLKPGGRMYLTVHDNRTIEMLTSGRVVCQLAEQLAAAEVPFREGFAFFTLNRTPGGGIEYSKHSLPAQVFYDAEYLRRHWGNYMEVERIVKEAYGYQSAMVLRKSPVT
ncbi:MAG TPA: class I SAM-dependent methyltransferase [Pyrinomonadaceae bacterium]